ISDIGDQVTAAIATIAARVPGPVRLVGHSAGGQLVVRAATRRTPWLDRLAGVVTVSPVADLAPLMRTTMNADLRIDADEAATQSPVHLPAPAAPVTVWVGAAERPAFLEQATLLSEIWQCPLVVAPDRHHFSVIEDLATPESHLTRAIVA
ncbi:alpha/beta hydrolase, partial [Yoonia sp.]|uniref:alpha/beta hydrolase n=1 Tax=Yoonia sp. TaxID=2212373 RepID=UPI003F6D5C97